MTIYANRTLNMKAIKAIGFDMDYTLVRYNSEAFEQLTYQEILKKLVSERGYPQAILQLPFNYHQIIRGLVIDKIRGNFLKLSLHGKVKKCFHGTKELPYKQQQDIYGGLQIDLTSEQYSTIDTSFSISYASAYANLINYKDQHLDELPDYAQIESDVLYAVDISHQDGSLKGPVKENIGKYIIADPMTAIMLERLKKYQKKLWVITNSDYSYTKTLLDYTITPYLKEHKNWLELFDLVITGAAKPRFFTDRMPFLKIDVNTGSMVNTLGPYHQGLYQGGCAKHLQKDAGFDGDEILYLGDHIYGDVLSIKKTCNWRTALVIEELINEVEAQAKARPLAGEIQNLMEQKEVLENELDQLYAKEFEHGEKVTKEQIHGLFDQIQKIDQNVSKKLREYENHFNPLWGEITRAGNEPSRFAGQIEKYACVYMSKVSDLAGYSPRKYFRTSRKLLPHENN